MTRRVPFVLLFLTTFLHAQVAPTNANVPQVIRYTGSLTSQSVSAGVTGVTFALYRDRDGGSPLWVETQNVALDATGHYSVLLGSASKDGLPAEIFSSNEARWLGVRQEGQAELPRVLLVSVPYALKAGDAQTLGGLPPSAYALNVAPSVSKVAANLAPVVPGTPVAMDIATSAGTTNFVSKWTNATTLGNSLIFDDGTNIGIGTTTPQAHLDVNGGVGGSIFRGFSAEFITSATNGPQFDFRNAATPVGASWRIGVPGFLNATSFFIYDYVNQKAILTMEKGAGLNSLYFKAGGNVGVGTTTPGSKFTVVGTVESSSGGFKFPDATVQTTAAVGTVSGVTAGTGITGGGTTGNVNVALDQAFTDGRYARLSSPNTFTGDQTTTGNVIATGTVSGNTLTAAGAVNAGTVAAIGSVSATAMLVDNANPGAVSGISSTVSSGTATSVAVLGQETSLTGSTFGLQGTVSSTSGIGVQGSGPTTGIRGLSTGSSGLTEAVGGYATSSNGIGVHGKTNTAGGSGSGVFGETVGGGSGVLGSSFGVTGTTHGVFGTTGSPAGTGVTGDNKASGGGTGVHGVAESTTGQSIGVQGSVSSTTDGSIGVQGVSSAASGAVIGVQGIVSSNGASIGVQGTSASPTAQTGGAGGVFTNTGGGDILVGYGGLNGATRAFRVDNTGAVFGNGAFNTSGADFAESFDVSGAKAAYQPGDVLMIDESGTRRLALSNEPYSTKVAGVYATKPGVLASPYTMDDPRRADGVPLAVIGVVPCKVSAENGPIHSGDLLVTASRPGFAMKGTDREKMLGAIVGKALAALENGTGVIEVLVSLH